jgi:hypothetical protein
MKTTNISVMVNTRSGKKTYNGRGFIAYPLVVHRQIDDVETMEQSKTGWSVTHIASGRRVFKVSTIKDAKRMVEILSRFDLFKMPECDRFYELCEAQGESVKKQLTDEGFQFALGRFK